MKARESGMPEESVWAGFFAPETILRKLGLTSSCGDVVDFGCGYGTFTIPAARIDFRHRFTPWTSSLRWFRPPQQRLKRRGCKTSRRTSAIS